MGRGVSDGVGVGAFVLVTLDDELELLGDELTWLDDGLELFGDELPWLDDELVLVDELGCELVDGFELDADRSCEFVDELDEEVVCEFAVLDALEALREGISGKSDP